MQVGVSVNCADIVRMVNKVNKVCLNTILPMVPLMTYYNFVLLYQHFNAKSTSMFDNICFGCITIRVKGVLVSCIPRFRYRAIYCMGSFIILERARRRHY